MMPAERAELETSIVAAIRGGRFDVAATNAIKGYGPEIYGLLASIHKERQDADDVFSLFCEKLWKGIPRFEGRSSLRTWAYTVAWSASSRFRTQKAARRFEVLNTSSEISALAIQVRTDTLSRMRNERRSRLRELRQTLPIDDQLLLVLRVDRELDWKDLARVMNPDTELDDTALTRESARLRQRYKAVKDRLRDLIRAATDE